MPSALALLLPMLVTLPGPGGETAPARAPALAPHAHPTSPPVDASILPPPQPLTDVEPEETLRAAAGAAGGRASEPAEATVAAEPEPQARAKDDGALRAIRPAGRRQRQRAPCSRAFRGRDRVEPEAPAKDGAEAAPVPKPTAVPQERRAASRAVPQRRSPAKARRRRRKKPAPADKAESQGEPASKPSRARRRQALSAAGRQSPRRGAARRAAPRRARPSSRRSMGC